MIRPGGPLVCTACRAMMHEPTEACPYPYVCTYEPGECGDPRCVNHQA